MSYYIFDMSTPSLQDFVPHFDSPLIPQRIQGGYQIRPDQTSHLLVEMTKPNLIPEGSLADKIRAADMVWDEVTGPR